MKNTDHSNEPVSIAANLVPLQELQDDHALQVTERVWDASREHRKRIKLPTAEEISTIRQAAKEDGRQEGFEAGYQAGMQAGMQAAQEQIKALDKLYHNSMDPIGDQYQQYQDFIEQTIQFIKKSKRFSN